MEEFIFHPLRPGMELKSRKDRLKIEMLRFHPDKFNSNIVRKLRECDREKATEIAGALARMLTDMLTEEIQKETGP
jgi:preprotein translocase subunit Sec63